MIELYQFPLAAELVEITVPLSPALAEVPTSAVVWLERHGVTTEYPATLQPGATTTSAVVVWDASGRVLAAGRAAYRLSVRLRNSGGTTLARSVPLDVNVTPYPPTPA